MSVAQVIKRVLDVAVAGGALLVASPLLAASAAAVWLDVGTPILFRQRRIGKDASPFELYKLRTMRAAIDKRGRPLPDGERLTAVGKFLRASSLDEIPQLWNVLRGDMSLVGPRPLLPEYLPRYSPAQARRHDVKPGVTGLAQIEGRNALSWPEKFRLDLWYIDHWSLVLDAKILVRTVAVVLSRSGISAPGSATMPPFQGET
ncbi:MAG TPA: sugar transferase [Kofleriaceae bacterium]